MHPIVLKLISQVYRYEMDPANNVFPYGKESKSNRDRNNQFSHMQMQRNGTGITVEFLL